ncbi:hypothetical protein [Flavobacterium sp. ZB4P13]|uniref:hypothetical protein n=1 Tax=Flavobacterium sp. ZB4P13 TaxID=3401728 RepID=UPI003AAE2AF6
MECKKSLLALAKIIVLILAKANDSGNFISRWLKPTAIYLSCIPANCLLFKSNISQ